MITSPSNQRVKDTIRLRERRGRQRQGRILVEGRREIRQALDADIQFLEAFVCRDLHEEGQEQLVQQLLARNTALHEVNLSVWEKLAFGDRQDGILGTAVPPRRELADLQVADRPLIAVLERVEKPGNVGAVCRTVDAVGADALIVADAGTDLFNPNVIRASLGTVFRVPVIATSAIHLLSWLAEQKIGIIAARVGEGPIYCEVDWTQPVAIVLGSESDGLTSVWSTTEVTSIHLPMRGAADSLNVSNSAAILLYEAWRQRHCDFSV